MPHIRLLFALGFLAVLWAEDGAAQEMKVEMVPVKYAGLKEEVLKHRGKVVLVDFWAGYCTPCREAFPHLIEIHTKFAAKGLIVISVSVDPSDKKDLVEQANAFLRKMQPPFVNLLLDEPDTLWNEKFGFTFPPCCYVFDRRGKWTRLHGADYEKGIHGELEQMIARMLDDK
jgi:thiol-disulfide isomerase/thioredoxin